MFHSQLGLKFESVKAVVNWIENISLQMYKWLLTITIHETKSKCSENERRTQNVSWQVEKPVFENMPYEH